ncbi:MAG: ATP-binding cassette domain-containing protein [Candidatus Eisenbacteria sp.]|nr:ATP-binding cassette domain-containing protein [Candidatus Eisenbacteria bacterium]
MIVLETVGFRYEMDTTEPVPALEGISLSVTPGTTLGIAGASGSGKTTLLQVMCGLLLPTSGTVRVEGRDLSRSTKARRRACILAGLVFQFPERQLFEATVADDVAYGPRNLGLERADVEERVRHALGRVELDPDTFGRRSPLSLSFGEMRRVALAGVLALKPRVLLLDEPTAGLDERGKRNLEGLLRSLHEGGVGVVVASHDVGFLAEMVQDLVLLENGRAVVRGPVVEILGNTSALRQAGVAVPFAPAVLSVLGERGWRIETGSMREDAVADALVRAGARPVR